MTVLLLYMDLRVSLIILCNSLQYFVCTDEDSRCTIVIHGDLTSAVLH
jgi:hypothetical protein